MGHQVFEIEAVRRRCLELLRKEDRTLTTGAVCVELGLPYWATNAGLEEARRRGEVEFTAGAGWRVVKATLQQEAP